jgi:hypothetical protein
LTQQAKQDVLGPDEVVADRPRLAHRKLKDLLGLLREHDLRRRDRRTRVDGAKDLLANAIDADIYRREQQRCQPLLLTHQPEQDVLTADPIVLERPRFLVRADDH